MALNLHRLLHGTETIRGFRANIRLPEADERVLRAARDAIREELRRKFRAISDAEPLQKAFLIEARFARVLAADALQGFRVRPKFRSQGSYVYRTLNDPAPPHTPPQQVDLDDGVFLPTSFVNGAEPVVAAKAFFKAVEDALEPLCARQGWILSRGEKSSCVRIYVSRKIHIDLPLYAIPDGEYLDEELLAKADQGSAEVALLSERQYRQLPADHIMLAEREGSWRRSDPRKLEDWFLAAVRRHGEVLRRVCRYLKAWRDHQWADPQDGIASIALMAMAVQAFDRAVPAPPTDREDRALLMVAQAMPAALSETIENPVVEGETLDGGWLPERRRGYVERARELTAALAAAMGGNSPDAAIVRMQDSLGPRVPDEPSLVESEAPEEEALLGTPRRKVPAPVVGRSVSG